jgi:asparagine synthase (glutamine-hydrolysing)
MGAFGGIVPRRPCERAELVVRAARMRDALASRAPIEGGIAVAYDASVALVHRGGMGPGSDCVVQPLRNDSGSVWLVVDGEPSNADDLRLELVGRGHRFRSSSAGEVVLHLYELGGAAALERLTGSFAFALWDRAHHELVLGRDRLGTKPLYVAEDGRELRFGSGASILGSDTALDPAAVVAFLALGHVPGPLAVPAGVRAVEPGTIVRVRGTRITTTSMTDDAVLASPESRLSDGERIQAGALARAAAQIAVGRETAVGVVLDGAAATGALLAVTRPMLGRGLTTHAFVYDGVTAERARLATAGLARWAGARHHEHRVRPSDLEDILDRAAAADAPCAALPAALLAGAAVASNGGRVWLASLAPGGAFARCRDGAVARAWRAASPGLGHVLSRAITRAVAALAPFGGASARAGALDRAGSIGAAWVAVHGAAPATVARCLRPDVVAAAGDRFDAIAYLDACVAASQPVRPALEASRASAGRALAAIDLVGSTSIALHAADAAAAAMGIGVRAPFLDDEIVRAVLAAPAPGLLASLGAPPARLTRGAASPLPPLALWLRGPLRAWCEARLLGEDRDDIFDRDGLTRLWRAFLGGRAPAAPVLAATLLRAWIGSRHDRPRAGVPATDGPEIDDAAKAAPEPEHAATIACRAPELPDAVTAVREGGAGRHAA